MSVFQWFDRSPRSAWCHARCAALALGVLLVVPQTASRRVRAADPEPGDAPRIRDVGREIAGARYPFVTRGGDGKIYMCWLEPGPPKTFRLRFSVYTNGEFGAPRTIASGADWFVNWADVPSISALARTALWRRIGWPETVPAPTPTVCVLPVRPTVAKTGRHPSGCTTIDRSVNTGLSRCGRRRMAVSSPSGWMAATCRAPGTPSSGRGDLTPAAS